MTADEMARVAVWNGQQPNEHLQAYGSRVLQFLLAYAITAPLTDDDLELADHMAVYAVSSKDIHPTALQNISDTRHLIATMLKIRKRDHELATVLPGTKHDKPNIGPMARLETAPIVRPPSGQQQKVEVEF